ncbi:transmembrane protein 223 [Tachypleus tridentatus]|uniref:transmembrane protein 223 n=1 Tax=Tachypleus tridentatus TaxID=6853 RepID=UPI003FD33769
MLFKNEKSRFFKLLSFFGMIQLAFCMYLGHFSFKNLRDISQSDVETQIGKQKNELHGLSFWKKINLGENKYRYGITLLCCSVGYLIAVCTGLYTLRSVRYLILLRGGEVARLVTYTPFGGNRIIDVSLRDLSCQQARDQATSFLSLKVRNRWMFFLVDKRGTFLNPKLFDSTVGLYRTLK